MNTQKLLEFLAYAKQYIARFPKERSQLTYALQTKFIDKYAELKKDIDKKLDEKRNELDAKYCIKLDGGAFSERDVIAGNQVIFRKNFTQDGESKKTKEFDSFEKNILDEPVEVTPYIVDIPSGIDITWVGAFTGFVFKEMSEEDKEKWYFAQKEEDKKPK